MGLNLYGPVNKLGMGVHFTNWVGALLEPHRLAKLPGVFIGPKHGQIQLEKDRSPAEERVLSRLGPATFDPHGSSVSLWHLSDVSDFAGHKRAIYTVFEGTVLSQIEKANAGKVEAVFVPTTWAQQVMMDHKIVSWVIPEGIDPTIYQYGDTGLSGFEFNPLDPSEIRFLSVGKLEKRKGMEVMLDALIAAARADGQRPIHVLAQWTNPWAPQDHLARFMASRYFTHTEIGFAQEWIHKDLQIKVTTYRGHIPRNDYVAMIRACHFGLFPYFAEGWCLPLQESMACGLPPICQFYSGPTEYLKEGSFIPLEGVKAVARDNMFFKGDHGTWSQVSLDSCVAGIERAIRMGESDRRAMGLAASGAARVYTWDSAADRTIQLLKDLRFIP